MKVCRNNLLILALTFQFLVCLYIILLTSFLLVVNVFSDVKVLLQNTICDTECSVEVTVLAIEDDGRILVNIVTRYIESTKGDIYGMVIASI